MLYKASAPGSLMLMGEYAVLYGKSALVCAIDKRITVTLQPRTDNKMTILSDRYGEYVTDSTRLTITPPYRFVLACLYQHRKKLETGCDITITSEFSDQIGLGSSAAVTVATLAVLFAWKKSSLNLIQEARRIIRCVQGLGSGADAVASVLGGMVVYRSQPFYTEKFSLTPSLTVIYSGSKTPTVEAINKVHQDFSVYPALFKTLRQSIHQCTQQGIPLLRKQNWQQFGKIMNIQQGLMQAMGVSTPLLNALIHHLRTEPTIWGAKISGSGLGDCVIGLGEADMSGILQKYEGAQQIKVNITQEGVK